MCSVDLSSTFKCDIFYMYVLRCILQVKIMQSDSKMLCIKQLKGEKVTPIGVMILVNIG